MTTIKRFIVRSKRKGQKTRSKIWKVTDADMTVTELRKILEGAGHKIETIVER